MMRRSSDWNEWKGPLLTALAYYIGVKIGFELRFPPATTSVMWPPNAILTVALLLSAPARWWKYLVLVFPVHVLAELPVLEPAKLIPLLYVTNCCEALIAATVIRRFSDAPTRFDTLHRMTAFIGGAVFAAPFFSSFLDAAIVSVLSDERYWSVFATRMLSNSLTELTLVPPAVILFSSTLTRTTPKWPAARVYEIVLLAGLTTLVGYAVFGGHLNRAWHVSGLPAVALVLPLPFLLLSALRFGPAGASLSLLMTSGILIWLGMGGRGPFSALSPAEAVPAVQTFLTVEAIPLMCLAAVLEERRKTAAALRERLEFERLLSQLSREFVTRTTQESAERFDGGLANCAAFFSADEILLLRRKNGEHSGFTIPHSWSRQPPLDSRTDGEWHYDPIVTAIEGGTPSILSSSVMVAPLNAAKQTLGGLAMHALAPRRFAQEDLERMQLIGEVFANVFARMRIEDRRAQAELEAQQSRAELAHFNRLSTMGELTASLAHELNQPLTGILGNAQAAQRMLASQQVDLNELRDILNDIVADDQRAGETIQRMRKLLRRTEGDIATVDLNDVIHEVAGLLKSDAIIRNLRLELQLWPAPLEVRGDPVELRQLVLNLILNAMDAMAHGSPPDRAIVVSSDRSGGHVHVSVQDCGEGIAPEAAEHIFEPFYTTKANGMGMGLSIARSIVESHGGSIWMTSNADHGALFEFKLPL